MKSFRVTCLFFSIGLAAMLLLHTGLAAAGSPQPGPESLLCGSYSGIFSGYLVTNTGNQPLAGTGFFISDCKGNISGHEVFNLNGNACPYQLKGTYTLEADGTEPTTSISSTADQDARMVRSCRAWQWLTAVI
jgi:hypothetical protein